MCSLTVEIKLWGKYNIIMFVVFFTLVCGFVPGNSLLVWSVACDWLLLAIAIITAFLITSDDCAPRHT